MGRWDDGRARHASNRRAVPAVRAQQSREAVRRRQGVAWAQERWGPMNRVRAPTVPWTSRALDKRGRLHVCAWAGGDRLMNAEPPAPQPPPCAPHRVVGPSPTTFFEAQDCLGLLRITEHCGGFARAVACLPQSPITLESGVLDSRKSTGQCRSVSASSRVPSLCPATVPLTPSAGSNDICDRQ